MSFAMSRVLVLVIAMSVVLIGLGAASAEYQTITVSNGASCEGTVRFAGTLPGKALIIVDKDAEACGDTLVNKTLLVGPSKGIRNAIVSIEGITAGKTFAVSAEPYLTNKGCAFEPRVQVVPVGTRLAVRNDDPILHNTHAYFGEAETVFNIALPIKDLSVKKELKQPGLIRLVCDAGHTWMHGYILVSEHPYHAVTDENGDFSIKNVPPGNYTLKIWHESLGEQTQSISLGPNETKSVSVSFQPVAPPPTPRQPQPPADAPSAGEN